MGFFVKEKVRRGGKKCRYTQEGRKYASQPVSEIRRILIILFLFLSPCSSFLLPCEERNRSTHWSYYYVGRWEYERNVRCSIQYRHKEQAGRIVNMQNVNVLFCFVFSTLSVLFTSRCVS